jgi:hypothetical protein
MNTFELKPTNGRKSFYGKCHVNQYKTEYNGVVEEYSDLVSYGKRVAAYNHTANEYSIYSVDSNTTLIHINTFLEFYGFDALTKQQAKNLC